MKKLKFASFRMIACAFVYVMLATYEEAATYRNVYLFQNANSGVDIDLEKLDE